MLLGKRPRPPIRRTTSMTGITVDLNNVETQEPYDMERPKNQLLLGPEGPETPQHYLGMLSPRNYRRNSADFTETPHFLRTCGLCKRRLASGRDLYMYRGDTAFCSLECREQKMKEDERKEKCMTSNEEQHTTSSNSKASGKRQTVVAA